MPNACDFTHLMILFFCVVAMALILDADQ